jgi:superfamily II DNA/RNA helicase
MPLFIADYLHRVGRVGRLGSKNIASGRVTNFVSNKFDADLVWNIERSIRLGVELQDVNANIKRLYNNITNSLNK